MLKEFKAFVLRGSVLDLAIGIIIGAAFGTIVKSLVDDVIMPPIGLALGNVDFANLFALLKAGPKAPPPYATIVAFVVFLVVRAANRLRPQDAAAPSKDCPYCRMAIPVGATRCPHCTTELGR
jgi:large conductance mechanosensitive channel